MTPSDAGDLPDAGELPDTGDLPDPGGPPDPATGPDPADLRDLAVSVARRAGRFLIDERPDELTTATKSTPTDVVTNMDRGAERLITDAILAERPDDGILGEEGGERRGRSGVRWIVDPLDGTVNYLYAIPTFAVSIAAEVEGTVVAGAVYDAPRDVMHEAVLGGGARADGVVLQCSRSDDLAVSLLGTGFGYDPADRRRDGAVVARLLPLVRDIRRAGSAALDLCSIAAGRLDAYAERGLHPWDRAAGLLIAAEAGARGTVVDHDDSQTTLAAAPGIFDALIDAWERCRREAR